MSNKADENWFIWIFLGLVSSQGFYAEAFNQEGDSEFRKGEYNYAIVCYTEGIKKNCDNKNINAKLFTNRAAAHLHLGKNLFFSFICAILFNSFLVEL